MIPRLIVFAGVLAVVLTGCVDHAAAPGQDEILGAHIRACEAKATILAAVYPCPEAVIRLNALMAVDQDCRAYMGDAGPGVTCVGEGPISSHVRDAGAE